jgi:hypothetical protein
MKVLGYRSGNRWVIRPIDQGWRRWLTRSAAGALALAAVLAAFISPRQSIVRTRYRTAQLSEEMARLQAEQRSLLLERERLTSPAVLVRQLADLGLEPVLPEQIVYFTASGQLLERTALAKVPEKTAAKAPAKTVGAVR